MQKFHRLRFAILVLPFLLIGCNTSSNPQPHMWQASSDLQASEAYAKASHGSYVLRPTDQIRVQVYNEPNISGDYQIDSSGFVSVPLAGRVKASGATTAQLEKSLAARLNNGLLKDPRVSIQISGYAPFYIHGEVKRSGEFPFRPGLTVMDAIATAGGYTYRANEGQVFVRRAGTDAEYSYPMDARIAVFPGDNIRIPERFF
jgi:polysaccharide export outer membrane protein